MSMYGFKCPDCGCCKLEEILTHAVVVQDVFAVDVEELYYHNDQECKISDGFVDRYQCSNCGWVIPEITTIYELYCFLKEQHEAGANNLKLDE